MSLSKLQSFLTTYNLKVERMPYGLSLTIPYNLKNEVAVRKAIVDAGLIVREEYAGKDGLMFKVEVPLKTLFGYAETTAEKFTLIFHVLDLILKETR